jgi:hypothetical protein
MKTATKLSKASITKRQELKYLPRSVVCHSASDVYLPDAVVVPGMIDDLGVNQPIDLTDGDDIDSDTDDDGDVVDLMDTPHAKSERLLLMKDVASIVQTRKKRKNTDNTDLGVDVERITNPKKPTEKKARHTQAARYHLRMQEMMSPNNLASVWHTLTTCKKLTCTIMPSKDMVYEAVMVTAEMPQAADQEQHLLNMFWNWPAESKVMYVDGHQCCRSCFCAITQIKVSH